MTPNTHPPQPRRPSPAKASLDDAHTQPTIPTAMVHAVLNGDPSPLMAYCKPMAKRIAQQSAGGMWAGISGDLENGALLYAPAAVVDEAEALLRPRSERKSRSAILCLALRRYVARTLQAEKRASRRKSSPEAPITRPLPGAPSPFERQSALLVGALDMNHFLDELLKAVEAWYVSDAKADLAARLRNAPEAFLREWYQVDVPAPGKRLRRSSILEGVFSRIEAKFGVTHQDVQAALRQYYATGRRTSADLHAYAPRHHSTLSPALGPAALLTTRHALRSFLDELLETVALWCRYNAEEELAAHLRTSPHALVLHWYAAPSSRSEVPVRRPDSLARLFNRVQRKFGLSESIIREALLNYAP